MNDSRKYDPPEAVLAPAFKELLERLRKARQTGVSDTDITDEERKVVEYGVTERKRVLEHTLFLVFGQWAVYRQFISSLKSRQLRLTYGMISASATIYFMRNRAMRVSHEMFASMATTSTTSPLGNEVRIILAELEGPSGPYFKSICLEKGFAEDLENSSSLEASHSLDPALDHLHPQLRLRPRLLPDATVAEHPGVRQRGREAGVGWGRRDGGGRSAERERGGLAADFHAMREKNASVYKRGDEWQNDPELEFDLDRRDGWQGKWKGEEVAKGEEEDGWGKPFDFSPSAKSSWDEGEESHDGKGKQDEEKMTAGQRRADERRRRRMKMRAQKDGESRRDDN